MSALRWSAARPSLALRFPWRIISSPERAPVGATRPATLGRAAPGAKASASDTIAAKAAAATRIEERIVAVPPVPLEVKRRPSWKKA